VARLVLTTKLLSLVKSEVFVGTVILAVTQLVAFAQKVATVVPFFCTVKFAVQIVGLFDKSL
jgi:cephalosporin-C deacetylase-like acetyl esterase